MRSQIYLDYNATQPLKPAARAAMLAALAAPSNASSVHGYGQAARHLIESARGSVAGMIGARPDEIVFTAGATEANATALRGFAGRVTLVSAVEHPSVREAADCRVAPVDGRGVIDLEALDRMLREIGAPALVSLMLVNNETGVIQPVAEAAAIAHAHGALIHSDAAQAPGRIKMDVGALGVDLLTLSAHKIGGPQGAGALYIRDGVALIPLIRGGGQEGRRRGGTENVAAIAGFGAAARTIGEEMAGSVQSPSPNPLPSRERAFPAPSPLMGEGWGEGDARTIQKIAALRDRMERALLAIAPDLVVHGAAAPRVGNTSCFGVPGLSAETALIALDLAGIAVSSGAACSSGAVEPSRVLLAMGLPAATAREAIRVSLGWATTPDDVDRLVENWAKVYQSPRR